VDRLPEREHADPVGKKLKAYSELQEKLRRWPARPGSRRSVRLGLLGNEVEVICAALTDAQLLPAVSDQAAKLSERAWTAERLFLQRGPRAAARAMGWSRGTRGASKKGPPIDLVVRHYIWLLGLEPYHGMKQRTAPRRLDGSLVYPRRGVTSKEALEAVTREFGYPTLSACKQALVRKRMKIRQENERRGGSTLWSLVDDFPIPDLRAHKKP